MLAGAIIRTCVCVRGWPLWGLLAECEICQFIAVSVIVFDC